MMKMLNRTSEAMDHLRSDLRGVVSFEYVIVVSCIAGAVSLGFGAAGGGGSIVAALSSAIAAFSAHLPH